MALQGTIDAFPLSDVLRLLSSSSRTGRLVLEGDRGTATLWIDDGHVVGGGGTSARTAESIVFELLRFSAGSFSFDAEVAGTPDVQVTPAALDEAVSAAHELLEEWRTIEAVVPSTRHRVGLARTLATPTVTVDAADWPVLVAVGGRPAVGQLLEELDLGEYDGCATVAALVGAGLLEVDEPDPSTAAPAASTGGDVVGRAAVDVTTAPGPVATTPPPFAAEVPDAPAFPDHFPIDDLVGSEHAEVVDPWTEITPATEPVEEPADEWDEVIDDTLDPTSMDDGETEDATDEVLRQMSRLSPKAAEAIAAALHPTQEPVPTEEPGQDGAVSFLGTP